MGGLGTKQLSRGASPGGGIGRRFSTKRKDSSAGMEGEPAPGSEGGGGEGGSERGREGKGWVGLDVSCVGLHCAVLSALQSENLSLTSLSPPYPASSLLWDAAAWLCPTHPGQKSLPPPPHPRAADLDVCVWQRCTTEEGDAEARQAEGGGWEARGWDQTESRDWIPIQTLNKCQGTSR